MSKIQKIIQWIFSLKEGEKIPAILFIMIGCLLMVISALWGSNEGLHKTVEEMDRKHNIEVKELNDKIRESYMEYNRFLVQSTINAQRMKDSLYMSKLRSENLKKQINKKR